MTASPQVTLERRRTGWDVLFGVLSVIAGFIVLGHVALAGVISVLFTGWMLLIGGVVLVVGAVVNWSDPPRRWGLASGALIGMAAPGAGGRLSASFCLSSMLIEMASNTSLIRRS